MELCTLTGAEDSTDLDALWALSARFPFVEWGILLCVTSAGTGRYPTLEWIDALGKRLKETKWPIRPQFSLHICGRAAKEFIDNDWTVTKLAAPFDRIQVNFKASQFSLDKISAMIARHHPKTIITQYNDGNEHLAHALRRYKNHKVVFDTSEGRGMGPMRWIPPLDYVRCGYAGGLGPDNIEQHLLDIDAVADGQPYWIGMAASLRGEGDRFDLKKAEAVLERVANTISTNLISPWQEEAIARHG